MDMFSVHGVDPAPTDSEAETAAATLDGASETDAEIGMDMVQGDDDDSSGTVM
jgi:hypothetical protein